MVNDRYIGRDSRRRAQHSQVETRQVVENQYARRVTRRSQTLVSETNDIDNQDHNEIENSMAVTRTTTRPQTASTPSPLHNGTLNGNVRRSLRRHCKTESPEDYSSSVAKVELGEHEESRRSLRQRKLIHRTFNESELTALPVRRRHHQVDSLTEGNEQNDEEDENVEMDMYTRVKRARRKVKRDMYGMPLPEEEENQTEEEATTENEEEEEEEEDDADEENGRAQYNLRQNKPRTKLYEATIEKKTRHRYFKDTPPKKRYSERTDIHYKSPAHRIHKKSRRKRATHRSSSTSSSSSESEDERSFARRKSKSMAKARQRCLPMNMNPNDLTLIMKDRQKVGASLADIDPMSVDTSVTFDSVGGLADHIQSLKEMIVFPLLYPEVFEKFKIAPPRGVLFHGPPGTGKTLMARALANECSTGEKKVSFFMRKGADCLSKWVGESERQLRLLFDQAYQVRPAIIFFDEIDGLAPVRSSRQDQIHSSIVSTLLALMDGLDSRGEVVVIGATNRIDSIDPALRRPGRFDREFLFTLPSAEARAEILRIHTKEWNPKLLDCFIAEVAAKCNGYCGADMKALCTEAALHALRRRYPQIYTCSDKLQLDVSSIDISACDFHYAISKIVPAGQRAVLSPGRPLSPIIKPLLVSQLNTLLGILSSTFPFVDSSQKTNSVLGSLLDVMDDESTCVTDSSKNKRRSKQTSDTPVGPFLDFAISATSRPIVNRPRLLLYGDPSQGHTTHLSPALIHSMEKLPVHVLDLPTLYANSTRTAEESCAQVFREARRSTPSVIYIPHIDNWWQVLSETMKATFILMINDSDPLIPILLLATSDVSASSLPAEIRCLFTMHPMDQYQVQRPNNSEIRSFFEDLLLNQTCKPPATKKRAARNLLEVLPKAPASKPTQLTESEEKVLWDHEEAMLRELRLFLRDMLNKLARDRKFNIFTKPVDDEEVPDYYEIIKTPMDLSTMMAKIDLHQYQTCKEFLDDIDLICTNALEYNPDDSAVGRAIRHRACALKDMAHALIDAELDEEFEKKCQEILESRHNRGKSPSKTAPKYYRTKPLLSSTCHQSSSYPVRYSKRLRQEEVEPLITAETTDATKFNGIATQDTHNETECKSSTKKRKRKSRWAQGKVVRKRRVDKQEVESDEASDHDELQLNDSNKSLNDHIVNGNCDDETARKTDSPDVVPEEELPVGDVAQAKKDLLACFEEARNTSKVSHALEEVTESAIEAAEEAHNTNDTGYANTNDASQPSLTENNKDDNKGDNKADNEIQTAPDNQSAPDTVANLKPVESTPTISKSPVITETVLELEPVQNQPQRLTRSMASDPHILQCMEILEEAEPTFTINKSVLPALLEKAVDVCQGRSIAEMEHLYSLLAHKIYHHRSTYDRSQLLQDVHVVLEKFNNSQ